MFSTTDIDGTPRLIEAVDVNVWHNDDSGRVGVTGYEMYRREDGYWDTNTAIVIFEAETGFDPDEYDDDWFGWSGDSTPADMPAEVRVLVDSIMKEVLV